jgi:hypothetical protein
MLLGSVGAVPPRAVSTGRTAPQGLDAAQERICHLRLGGGRLGRETWVGSPLRLADRGERGREHRCFDVGFGDSARLELEACGVRDGADHSEMP